MLWRSNQSAPICVGVHSEKMGSALDKSLSITTGIEPGSRPWTARSVRVPLRNLSLSMRSMHNRGLTIESITWGHPAESQSHQSTKARKPKAAADKVGVDKTTTTTHVEKPKTAKRGSRRRRS